jgi:hypothetical protein
MGELRKMHWRILAGFGGLEKSFKYFLCCYNTLKDTFIKVLIHSDKAFISRTIILLSSLPNKDKSSNAEEKQYALQIQLQLEHISYLAQKK